ncbi:TRAP transporter small permease [Puniceibacterium sp. IMCC21224]|uniref:TRAP transporter small permease n=1 Tax=Puniceibacterium sp. IMCC21224 TaxID=1618204 RepID=UPI00064DD40C|nr:TRAP transporter small permease [Puniceibacterium sp. IMCC21224]KMK64786.1 TRAP-type C4-dicarboxylate transport system, small permease component [Puniceibacterium sp. IMCC21224]
MEDPTTRFAGPTSAPRTWRDNKVIRTLTFGLWGLRRLVDGAALLLLGYMALAILVQITGRYVFNYSIAWSEETATFAQVWLTLLGAGIAMRYNQHVGVDFLIRKAPLPVQQLCSAASFALGAWFLSVVVIGSLSLVAIGFMVKSPALRIPMAVPYMALPVGFSYFLLEFALSGLPRILRPGGPDDATGAAA